MRPQLKIIGEIILADNMNGNVSVVIEAAAMNHRAKQMGFDATKTFEERLTLLIKQNEETK